MHTPGTLVYCTRIEPRTDAAPLVYTTFSRVVRDHADIGWTEVLPLRRFVHVEGYPEMGRALPLRMAEREAYGPLRVAVDAEPTEDLRPVFSF